MPNPTSPTTFVRAWPPSPDGVQPGGDELGFLRYCPRDPANALRVNVPKSSWVMLDPMVSAPNAIIGVSFDPPRNRSAWHFMHPGDVLYAGAEFYEFWIFNADSIDRVPGGLPVVGRLPVGYCGFLVGRAAPPSRGGVVPAARICGVCDNTGVNAAGGWLSIGACEKFRLTFLPISAAGALLASVWTGQITLQFFDPRSGADNTSTGLDRETLDSIAPVVGSPVTERFWTYGAFAADLVLPVDPAGIAVLVTVAGVTTWSGAAVDHLLMQAEGF